MISRNMRFYDLYVYGDEDSYGQAQLSKYPEGKVKIAIEVASQSIQDSVAYSGTNYTGITNDEIDDTCVIDFNGKMLKVLYVNNHGRFNQVYLGVLP